MAFRLNKDFFKKVTKVNRAIEITDTQAFIPAVKDAPEIRVALPNRRPKTFLERETELEERHEKLIQLEETIEVERANLLTLVKSYRETGSGVAPVVVQNQKVAELMAQRKALAYPEVWIEELKGINLKEIFESKRDTRKVDGKVFQVKRRVEPIISLYEDIRKEDLPASVAAPASFLDTIADAIAPVAEKKTTAAQAASVQRGAIVQQVKKSFTLAKKPMA